MKKTDDTKPLPRRDFSSAVLSRDGHKCVICGRGESDGVALDAHHILERRLFSDGGYYLSNGATLCDDGADGCHMKAETTEIQVEDLRQRVGIKNPVLPEGFSKDAIYDKWGNQILANGMRCRGPLFHEEPVQKVLAPILEHFTEYMKHPRTWHLPWSPGATSDDKKLSDTSHFIDQHVTVTRKMDGENFTGYRDYCHARSIDGRHHPSRDYAKRFWAERSYDLPDGWRVVCENLYAVHSLKYTDLPDWMLGLFIWDDKNMSLSFGETREWMQLLHIPMPEVLFSGIWNADAISKLHIPQRDDAYHEGYVLRLSGSFHVNDFKKSVAKYVRSGHVVTSNHWMHGEIEANGRA